MKISSIIYHLLLTVFCLLLADIAFAQRNQKITEADFSGVWLFEKAEYWEHTEQPPALVLREEITSPDDLGRLLPFCFGEGVRGIHFLEHGAMVEMLLTSKQNVEYRLQESEDGSAWLELHWRDEAAPEDIPAMTFRYAIERAEEDILVLTHEVLCHDATGAMHQNVLKMFLKTIR